MNILYLSNGIKTLYDFGQWYQIHESDFYKRNMLNNNDKNTEITILLFRARIGVTLARIGPTGTARINENDQDGEVWSDDGY